MTIKKLLYRLETIRDSLADRDGMDEYAIEGTMDDISLLMDDVDSFGVEDDFNEDAANKRMDVIGQNGNTGLHYDELKKDNCVLCNKETLYNKNNNIYNRRYYVEGTGQLCGKCWSNTYDTNKTT